MKILLAEDEEPVNDEDLSTMEQAQEALEEGEGL